VKHVPVVILEPGILNPVPTQKTGI